MGKLIEMPLQNQPYAFCVAPYHSGGAFKVLLIFAPWKSDEGVTARGFVRIADLLEELVEMGADRSIVESVRRSLEVGVARTIPKMWLTPPQVELLKSPPKLVAVKGLQRVTTRHPLLAAFFRTPVTSERSESCAPGTREYGGMSQEGK
jgi:hypothetical protein